MMASPLKYSEIQSLDDLASYCSSRGDSWMVSVVMDSLCGIGLFVAPANANDAYAFKFSQDFKAVAICLPSFFVVENAIRNDLNVFVFSKTCHFCRLSDSDFSLLRRFFKSLRYLEDADPSMLTYEARYYVCHALMDTFCLLFNSGVIRYPTRGSSIAFEFMKRVHANCTKERKMEYYASSFKLSSKYLASVISSETGMPVSRWIVAFTISVAKMYLRNRSLSVNQISILMNFKSTSDFSKYFRSSEGMSPNEYRRILLA